MKVALVCVENKTSKLISKKLQLEFGDYSKELEDDRLLDNFYRVSKIPGSYLRRSDVRHEIQKGRKGLHNRQKRYDTLYRR